MQWDASPHAGFTAGTPWLPVAADYDRTNVVVERDDPGSILTLYRRLLELRRSDPVLLGGQYSPLATGDGWLAYLRHADGRRLLVLLNLTSLTLPVELDAPGLPAVVVLSTHPGREGVTVGPHVTLAPDEGLIVALPEA
jgi:alpha-glucosidase